ncbi:MAG: hypothetical protein SGPRY_011378, partial [Prymnesium sp.]
YSTSCSPSESAARLRLMVRSQVLRFLDMRCNPEKFFLAHRLLASRMLGGFGVRFTVQYNLFAGSVIGLGDAEQIRVLEGMQERGDLGCFALTEVDAGVMSGLIVETTAVWDDGFFVIHTPHAGAEKNWISQGLVAEWVVVIAKLLIAGRDHGSHPFLVRMRRQGQLEPGIFVDDMGLKTVANDLDNARIRFVHCRVPREALLCRFASVSAEGAYQLTDPAVQMRMEVIGQRLMTGRLVIAEAAIVAARVLLSKTQAYAKAKMCNGIGRKVPLAELPQLRSLFEEANAALGDVEAFCAHVEGRLSACLRVDGIPDDHLVQAICITKVKGIDVASKVIRQLEEEVGSYALMASTGFEHKDMLLCCRFAEGDSMKIARDRLGEVRRNGIFKELCNSILSGNKTHRDEGWLALKLAKAMADAKRNGTTAEAWDEQWKMVYTLADS